MMNSGQAIVEASAKVIEQGKQIASHALEASPGDIEFKDLGLIIVDEEHEHSYKQEEAPRYHARDVAVVRGQMENAVVVLGSATPSMESFYNVQRGKYALLELPTRADDKISEAGMEDRKRQGYF